MADGFEAQVRQAFENLFEVLAANGMAASDLVQLNYYLPPEGDMGALRRIREDYLPEPPPASTALVVHALVRPEWLFEVDGVAARVVPA
jgi:enamine deaminase RidA (YjgF/YER057c/UK114 family)